MARTVSSTENLPGFNSEVEAAGALSIARQIRGQQIRGQVYFIRLTKKIVIVYSDAKTDTNSVRARALSRDEQRSRSTNNIPRNRLLRRFSDNFRGMS